MGLFSRKKKDQKEKTNNTAGVQHEAPPDVKLYKMNTETGEMKESPEVSAAFSNMFLMMQIVKNIYSAETEEEVRHIVRNTPFEVIEMIFKYGNDEDIKRVFLIASDDETKRRIMQINNK